MSCVVPGLGFCSHAIFLFFYFFHPFTPRGLFYSSLTSAQIQSHTDSGDKCGCTNMHFISFPFFFCLFFEEKDKVLFQFCLVPLVPWMYQSPSIPLQCVCCDSGWCKACTSLFFRIPFLLLRPIFSSLKAFLIRIDALLWGGENPN